MKLPPIKENMNEKNNRFASNYGCCGVASPGATSPGPTTEETVKCLFQGLINNLKALGVSHDVIAEVIDDLIEYKPVLA